MNEQEGLNRLEHLLPMMVEGQLSDAQLLDLSSILEESDACREFYIRYLDLETLLVEHWGATSGFPDEFSGVLEQLESKPKFKARVPSVPVPPRPLGLRLPVVTQVLMLAIIGLLMANLWLPRSHVEIPRTNGVENANRASTPQLVGMTACVWHNADSEPSLGATQSGEVLDLLEGIAEFSVRNQWGEKSKVRIEGPASVFVRSNGELGLLSGVLTAEVYCRRGEFRLDLPGGAVFLDGMGEIGIRASGGKSQLHVFEGAAFIESEWAHATNEEDVDGLPVSVPLMVSAGEAVTFSASPADELSTVRSKADRLQFASTRSLGFARLDLNGTYRKAVLESSPKIYWRFDSERTVSNEVGESNEIEMVGNVYWRQFGSNVSAEFGLTTTGGSFVSNELWPQEPLDEYTVELWVNPSHYHSGSLVGLCKPDRSPSGHFQHGLLLQLGAPYRNPGGASRPNQIRFLHRSPAAHHSKLGTSCFSGSEYEVRSWIHVVARKKKDRIQLFVNGELRGEEADATKLPSGMQFVIGQLYPDSNNVCRPFVGQIDEVAIYEHALSDEEIKRHFNASPKNENISDGIGVSNTL